MKTETKHAPGLFISDLVAANKDRDRLAEQNRELVEALRDLAGSAMAIRKGFCTDNPYRKHSDSHENWDSAMSENADLFDAAEENALAVLAKVTA